MSRATILQIIRYPVKGLSAEPLERVTVTAGETLPGDRIYAIENGPGRFDPEAPRHLPKVSFLMRARNGRLATLSTRFDPATHVLTIERGGRPVASGDLSSPIGRRMIEQFMAAFMQGELRGAPKVVSAAGHSFTDVAVKCLHIVNLASVRDLERVSGRAIDPLRFRANIYIDGLAPWEEFRWLDMDLAVGTARLSVIDRTHRCAATEVDPASGERNVAVTSELRRHFGHEDFGIYAKVITGGEIGVGDGLGVVG
ncbi:MAG TPA: MOSC domain-containing protein [Hyphomicrobiaceae bacterium]|nr:MOSC domain-containing protein [Hyphomicrobiaceae bacterium]